MTAHTLFWLLPLLPLAGAGLNGFFGAKLSRNLVAAIALTVTGIGFGVACVAFANFHAATGAAPLDIPGPAWIAVSGFHADFNLYVDHLTLLMLLIVTGVGFLIHIYSAGYMAHEDGYWRFFSYLNLFMFFMLVLVLAGNFLLMFVGWEGVGLASYLLIGFYFRRPAASAAGKKAFVVNRIGDFGFLLAMFLLIVHFGTLSYTGVFGALNANLGPMSTGALTSIALLMLLGATGKSAQIPLYIWLPDAMEGPTPVSALIHAATMVTAGVYMVARSHAIFDRAPAALATVAIIGAATAFFAATIGLVQNDIKRVLAYSTVSQLGYMFLACGVAAYSAAVFHLMTHAFFKALLFLAAGSVIHSLDGEQDMRHMGGLKKYIPITYWTMLIATLAIAGIPPFAGFVSKDEILYSACSHGGTGMLLWAVGLLTAFMTSFYMFRLIYMTFYGARRAPAAQPHTPEPGHSAEHGGPSEADLHGGGNGHHGDPHESPWTMLAPLCILALLSLTGGWIGWPEALGGANHFGNFLAPVFADTHPAAEAAGATGHIELILAVVSTLTALAGWFMADLMYRRRPEMPARLAASASGLYKVLAGKYFIDEFYHHYIVRPLHGDSRVLLFHGIERKVIDGGTRGADASATGANALMRRMQSGNIRSYAGWVAAGAAAVLILTLFAHAWPGVAR